MISLLQRIIFTSLILTAFPALAINIAFTDLDVKSDIPGHKYLGKGIAELVSFELGKSASINVISREKRSEMIREMSLSMTGLIDPAQQVKLGRMLAARFIISGSIINMGDTMLITMKMTDVETGKAVWQDKLVEKLSNYDFISGYFARSVLKHLNAGIDSSTIAKVEKKREKNEKSALSFSAAIDSYDKNQKEKARAQLKTAEMYDPENEVVRDYISKLAVTSSKFKVELDFYVPSQNPAVLGTIQQDKIYLIYSFALDKGENIPSVGDGYKLDETGNYVSRIGYEFPLGQRWGISLEFMVSTIDPKIEAPYTFYVYGDKNESVNTQYFHPLADHRGGNLSIGFALTDWLSIGASLAFYSTYQRQSYDGDNYITLRKSMDGSFGGGFILTLLDRSLYIDAQYTYCMEQEKYLNTETRGTMDARYPSILELTLTGALLERRLFLVGKEILDFYSAEGAGSGESVREGIMSRTIPSLEYWITDFLSLRAGYLYTRSNLMDVTNSGHGVIAGLTLRLGSFDIDFNYTYMERVSRLLPGYETDDQRFLIQLSKNATFIRSR